MLKVESLKTEFLEVSPPVPCGVVCVGVCLVSHQAHSNTDHTTRNRHVSYITDVIFIQRVSCL
jgi:hypothetical protein